MNKSKLNVLVHWNAWPSIQNQLMPIGYVTFQLYLLQQKLIGLLTQIISTYLLTIASTPPSMPSPEPVLQATSAIIDIYSDENMPYDVNFRQGEFLLALSNAIDNVKRVVKSIDRKRSDGRALRARGEEILTNLRAFVKYRRELKL